ncbi:DeoR/GlpR family DNA-binding transcription regulator [Selenomonas sp. TAMA-11512]|nr:DeoR/GlpR family DNA-binding transcription regulator [Selenomonas sp. TAMA-11512]
MAKMITAERRNRIAEHIIANGSIKAGELARTFGVSTETIRKDLIYLDREGIVKKSHGGALSALEFAERPLEDRTAEGSAEKAAIAEYAMRFIRENTVIFLDAGSTCTSLARLLYLKKGLTIFTTSLSVANVLISSENKLHMSGGTLNPITMALEGFAATGFLRQIHVDIAFLGTSGFQDCNGPTSIDFTDADVKRAILERARTKIVLAHSAKTQASALVEYTKWKNIHHLITDSNIRFEDKKRLSDQVDIIEVPPLHNADCAEHIE